MQKRTGAIIVAIAAACWSGSGVLGKYTTWSSISITGARALIAILLMAAFRGGFRVRLTKGNLLGAFGVSATSVLFITANKLTTAANAIVLQYAMPAFMILILWIFCRQRPTRRDVITVLFVTSGVLLCSIDSLGGGGVVGDLLALLSGLTYSLVFLCSRMKGADTQEYTYLGMLFSAPLTLFALFDPGATFTTPNILSLIGMGFCLAGGYSLIAIGMKRVTPMTAAITSNIEPVLNPLWVFLFLGETPGWFAIVGAAIVLTTVTIYSLPGRRERAA